MIQLFKLQCNFSLTKKVKVISAILIIFTWGILFLQSGLLEQESNLIYNRHIYIDSFLYDGFNIIKIIIVIYSMLLTIYTFHINSYDVFLVTRTSRFKVIISKILVVIFLEILFVLYLFTVYGIIWGLLDESVTIEVLGKYLSYLLILCMYYSVLNIALMSFYSSIFIVIIPLIGYLISNLSIDYGITIKEVSNSTKFLHLIFPDLFIYNKEIYYVYSQWFVLDISVLIIVLIIIKYKVDDIVI